ncbi:hypothetical protein PCC7424_3643 [Gloeothece citriformis PCC 7424]|uniref:Uncharacterized protein n=1 Tax=Gloeothece citriformis (strain PCC 7424) TaxID=65393 RepID=B7KHT0_GLOC7|nr:hypothetical protein PCC7424_3643 [Gloeothece citriformis PCC 7424]
MGLRAMGKSWESCTFLNTEIFIYVQVLSARLAQ